MSVSTTDGGSTERTARAYLFGRGDDGDDDPTFAVVGEFQNSYGDQRLVIESPAPWETPDDMTSANEVIKGLDWDEYHYSFEESIHPPGGSFEDVWVIDESGKEPLREAATEAGYEWFRGEPDTSPSEDLTLLAELAESLGTADWDHEEGYTGGDRVVVRYKSKQTGSTKAKEGMVNSAQAALDRDNLTTGFTFVRDDGGTNKVKEDGSDVGMFSTARYPFMGDVISVEVHPDG